MDEQCIRLLTDENIPVELAVLLRAAGYDVYSCRDMGRSSQSIRDRHQLEYAVREARAFLTFDVADFRVEHADYQARGDEHFGIILALYTQDVEDLFRRVRDHLDSVSWYEQHNCVVYLP